MKKNIFRGLGVALVTPFNTDGTIDFTSLASLIEYQIEGGIDFLCVLGTTAETPTLSAKEKLQVKDFVVSTVKGRVPLLLGFGGNNTLGIVEEIRSYDFTGIDGILSVVPYYNKPSQEGMRQHFALIAEAADKMPVVLYNVPGRTGVNMTADTTLRLANEHPNIVAIKEASGNIDQITDIIKRAPEGFEVLSGDDGITCQLMAEGAAGIISVVGNAIPEQFATMVHLMQQGKTDEALTIDSQLKDLYRLAFADGNPAGIKALLALKQKCQNVLRLPLVAATEATVEGLKTFA